MPTSFTVEPDRRLVLSRAWGVLVDDDLRRNQQGVRDDPRFAPDFAQLYDFSAVTEMRVTAEGLRAMADSSPFAPDARRAVVVASDAAFGLARLYQLASDRDAATYRIFRDVDAAQRWLIAGDEP